MISRVDSSLVQARSVGSGGSQLVGTQGLRILGYRRAPELVGTQGLRMSGHRRAPELVWFRGCSGGIKALHHRRETRDSDAYPTETRLCSLYKMG